ncbi:MAG TPA: oxygenase MpaB family protein [Solirubrobacteraceae bacterium]|nr:oxygenase MpaB family protein [Solirubrobacteraceae bacterium]
MSWRYGSDVRLYLVMLYPLLLQVAHPVVSAGVQDFSDFEARPWQRLLASLDYVTLLIYGGPQAAETGRRLREMHKRFRGVRPDGRRYSALEPSAYAWVHATLLDSYVSGHAQFGRPLPPAARDRFVREYRELGRLIGVRRSELPDDWSGFRAYLQSTIDRQLEPTESVASVLRAVQEAKPPPLPIPEIIWRGVRIPARRALWLGGVGLLPADLRGRLGIGWARGDERQFQLLGRLARACTPVMPPGLRVSGPTQLRVRRRAMARGPLGGGAPGPLGGGAPGPEVLRSRTGPSARP